MSLFPKVLWPFGITLFIWPWLRISPYSSLNVIYSLIITAWQWLVSFTYIRPVLLCKRNPRKAQGKRCSRPFSSERLVSLFSPSRWCLGRLILIHSGWESSAGGVPHNKGMKHTRNGNYMNKYDISLLFKYFKV